MLLIASETMRANAALRDVAREMSLPLSFFASADTLAELMGGSARRVVIMAETDVEPVAVQTLLDALGQMPFGIIVATDRGSLRSSNQAELVNKLGSFDNIEWLGAEFNFDGLSAAARRCRRRMLKVSRHDLENAFSRNEFVLRYQPKVERSTSNDWLARETEALIRWDSPSHGLLSPLEFLPEIEAFDLMAELGEYVLREAAAQVVSWENKGIRLNSCINLASSRLNDRNLAVRYADIVGAAGLKCSRFTFEIVEQVLTDGGAPHIRTLCELREQGFRICLDDFRGLAHNLGMTVSAEGIEDEATFEFLKTIECDKLQGFLISEAVLPNIIQKFYAATGAESEEVA